MSKRVPRILAEDMLEAVNRCLQYTDGLTFETFVTNNQAVDSVLRCLSVLGEAASQIPEITREAYPELPWHQMRGLRNRVVHTYFDLNLERVWSITQNNLPILKPHLEKLIQTLG